MSLIMVVDDEDDTRYIVRQLLEKEGHNVIEADDGHECLEKIRENIPDLIPLDIIMPGLDGWSVLAAIQRDLNLKSVPVTMFSVKPLTPETIRSKEALGLVNYIVKPFSSNGLINSITKALESISNIREAKEQLELLDSKKAEKHDNIFTNYFCIKTFYQSLKAS